MTTPLTTLQSYFPLALVLAVVEAAREHTV